MWAKKNNIDLGSQIKNSSDLDQWVKDSFNVAVQKSGGHTEKLRGFQNALEEIKDTTGKDILENNNQKYVIDSREKISNIGSWSNFKEFEVDDEYLRETVIEVESIQEDKGRDLQENSIIRIRDSQTIENVENILNEVKGIGKFRNSIKNEADTRIRQLERRENV